MKFMNLAVLAVVHAANTDEQNATHENQKIHCALKKWKNDQDGTEETDEDYAPYKTYSEGEEYKARCAAIDSHNTTGGVVGGILGVITGLGLWYLPLKKYLDERKEAAQ